MALHEGAGAHHGHGHIVGPKTGPKHCEEPQEWQRPREEWRKQMQEVRSLSDSVFLTFRASQISQVCSLQSCFTRTSSLPPQFLSSKGENSAFWRIDIFSRMGSSFQSLGGGCGRSGWAGLREVGVCRSENPVRAGRAEGWMGRCGT